MSRARKVPAEEVPHPAAADAAEEEPRSGEADEGAEARMDPDDPSITVDEAIRRRRAARPRDDAPASEPAGESGFGA